MNKIVKFIVFCPMRLYRNYIGKQVSCFLVCLFLQVLVNTSYAEELFDGRLEQLSSTPSISASKHQEDLFDTPISMSVVTGEQIKASGALSIPEALKLVPGVLVRELSNGLHEVHIRGFENTPQFETTTSLGNRSSLIMIDNRPVYNYFNGGTFWENLPVGIDDIARIEVIRGASSALYGANAMTGVIHIITKRPSGQQRGEVNINLGNNKTRVAHVSTHSSLGEHKLHFSGLYDQRNRYQSTYYNYLKDQYVDLDNLNTDRIAPIVVQAPKEAKNQTAFQISLNNDPRSEIAYDLSLSHQETRSHKEYLGINATALHEATINNSALNAQVNIHNLYLRLSHSDGESRFPVIESFSFDETVTQGSIEYEYRLPQWRIRPGIAYDEINYDAEFVGGKRNLRNKAAMLHLDYQPNSELRFISALRHDEYNVPSDKYISYQLLSTYKAQIDTMLRVGIEKAHRSPFIVERYVDIRVINPDFPEFQSEFLGDQQMSLTSIVTTEFGLRHQFSFNNWVDVEVFHSRIEDYVSPINIGVAVEGPLTVITNQYHVLPTEAKQIGLTVDWGYEALNWDVNVFLTAQNTKIKDQFTNLNSPLVLTNKEDKATPTTYGGFNFNWRPNVKWSFNSNLYYMHDYEIKLQQPQGNQHFQNWFTLNLNMTHHLSKSVDFRLALKNLSNRDQSQYFRTDIIEPTLLLGTDIRF